LIIFDEFHGKNIKFTLLKQVLDGQVCRLPQRYFPLMKTRNIPVIMMSNYSPRDAFKNLPDVAMDAFLRRLYVVDCSYFVQGSDFIDMFNTQ